MTTPVPTVHVRKGARTEHLQTRFRPGPGDSPTATELENDLAADARYLPLPVARVHAVVARLYGLDAGDFAWFLRYCDHAVDKVTDKPFSRTLEPKGFWGVDKEGPPELRHTVLSLVAFHALEKHGTGAFLALDDGEGRMTPDTMRLADYGLGHGLGPRFLDWQLARGVDEVWCRAR